MYKVWSLVIGILVLGSCTSKESFTKRDNRKVIKTSKKMIGVPYKWGGEDPSGMDCSGLLFYSYGQYNFQIPRVTSQQANFGKSLPIRRAKIGDWIMFATEGSKSINHVGIVVDKLEKKNLDFIHSSSSKGVRIDNITNSYWNKAYVKVVRPTKIKKK